MIRTILLVVSLFILAIFPSQARHYHRYLPQSSCVESGDVMRPVCVGNNFLSGVRSIKINLRRESESRLQKIHRGAIQTSEAILPHPQGCPRLAFCGCGAAVRLLGSPVRSLWLARNWYRFPRTLPAPNTAGVRPHHVIALIQHRYGNVWLAYDANSGHHMTRVHDVDISRYTIVSPKLM